MTAVIIVVKVNLIFASGNDLEYEQGMFCKIRSIRYFRLWLCSNAFRSRALLSHMQNSLIIFISIAHVQTQKEVEVGGRRRETRSNKSILVMFVGWLRSVRGPVHPSRIRPTRPVRTPMIILRHTLKIILSSNDPPCDCKEKPHQKTYFMILAASDDHKRQEFLCARCCRVLCWTFWYFSLLRLHSQFSLCLKRP